MTPESDLDFARIATREIEKSFDAIWPDGSWRPYKDDDGHMRGIQWGWVLMNGRLSLTVDGAGPDNERFKKALADAVERAVRKATYREAQRRQRAPGLAEVNDYLDEAHHGLLDNDRPQASIVIVPLPLNAYQLPEHLLDTEQDQRTDQILNRILLDTINQNQLRHFFPIADASFKAHIRDGYFEHYALDATGNVILWSVRLYLSGMVVYRTPVMYGGSLSMNSYHEMVRGTCILANKLYDEFKVKATQVCVLSKLVNLNEGKLAVRGVAGMGTEVAMIAPTPEIQIPSKLKITPREDLSTDSERIARRFSTELREYFEPGIDRFPRVS